MQNWKNYELECLLYLQKNFGNYAKFELQGGSNSSISDISVTTATHNFFIEVKSDKAQCGQFVLLPNFEKNQFEYNKKNKSSINLPIKKIISFMNSNFVHFSKPSTTGIKINMPNGEKIFSQFIKQHYRRKNVYFFISGQFQLFPLDKVEQFFSISAVYRQKKSGSRETSASFLNDVESAIQKHIDLNQIELGIINKRVFVSSEYDINKLRFNSTHNNYMLSHKKGNLYEVRTLSKTNNANVIFSISLKPNVKGLSKSDFLDLISLIPLIP